MDLSLPDSWDEARHTLYPVLRRVTDRGGDGLVRRPVAPFLEARIALDLEHARVMVQERHLEGWGVDAEHAWAAAMVGLDPTLGLRQREDLGGLWQLDSGDGYQISRLLVPGWLSAFADKVPGTPVAAVPHARLLLVGGTEDAQQLDVLTGLAHRGFREAGGPISPGLYTEGVVPWRPAEDHPLFHAIDGGHRLLAAWEYDQQRYALGPECSPVTMVNKKAGGSFLYCPWHRGQDSLLAETDYIVLIDGDDRRIAPFAAVREFLQPVAMEPVRYRGVGWPAGIGEPV